MGLHRQALRRCAAVGALAALTLMAASAAAGPTAPKVEILFVTPDPLRDFALDGDQVAWIGDRCSTDSALSARISSRALSGGPTRTIAPRPDDVYGDVCEVVEVALVGRRLFWVSMFGAHTAHERVETALIGATSPRTLGDHEADYAGASFVDAIAGDSGTFAYTWFTDERECVDDVCETVRETARASVFRDGKLTRFRLGSRAHLIAAAGETIATAEAAEIVVYTLAGRAVRRLKQSGFVGGLGMSGRWIAAVTASGRSRRLRVFDAQSGATVVTAELPTRSSRFQVAVSGTHAVVAAGRTVWALDIAGKSLTLLAQRPYIVRGLSIEGRRVAWGERVGPRGRVVSALLG